MPTLVGLFLVVVTSAVFTLLLAGPDSLRTLFASGEPAGASRAIAINDVVPTVGTAPVSRPTLEPFVPSQLAAPRTPPSARNPIQIEASRAETQLPSVADAVDRAEVAQAASPQSGVVAAPVLVADSTDREMSVRANDAAAAPDDAAATADDAGALAPAAADPTSEPPPAPTPAPPVVRKVAPGVPAARPTAAPARAVTRPVVPAPVPAEAPAAPPMPTKAPFVAPVRP